jgi:hypothetical protein
MPRRWHVAAAVRPGIFAATRVIVLRAAAAALLPIPIPILADTDNVDAAVPFRLLMADARSRVVTPTSGAK